MSLFRPAVPQPSPRRPLAGAALLLLLVSVFVAWQLDSSRRHAQAEAELTTQRLALTLENSLLAHLSSVDLVLDTAAAEFAARQAQGPIDAASFSAFLEAHRQRLRTADALRATDAEGRVLYGNGLPAGPTLSAAERSYFSAVQKTGALVVDRPVMSRASGQQVLPMARGVRDAQGRFIGMVYVFTNTERLAHLFASSKTGSRGVVTLFDAQRRILLRHPATPPGTDAPTTLNAAPTQAALAEGRIEATFRTRSSVDGIDRVLCMRRIGSFPLYVIVGVARDDYLAGWCNEVLTGVALLVTLALSLAVMGTLLQRAWQRREVAMQALQRNESELELSVESLSRSEARFRTLTDGLPQMVWMCEPDGQALFFSHHWSDFTGIPPEQLMDRETRLACIHPDDRPQITTAWAASLASGQPFMVHVRYRRHDGQWRVFDGRALPQRDTDGRIICWVGSNTDITESVLAHQAMAQARQAADEANRAKSAFLAMMSHEMRTPLNGVLGFAHLGLRDSEASERARQHFSRILDSGRLLLTLIDDLLDFSKIEAGKLTLEAVAVPLWPLLDEVLSLLDERAQAKGLRLLLDAAPRLPESVLVDPLRFKQVLLNLLSNAVKFTEQGEVVLRADIAGDDLVLVVQDSGIGMSAEQVSRLFRPFEQADSSTSRRFGGTGLGLAITHRLVTLMGGQISVRSEPGQGTRFEVRLPCQRPDLADQADPSDQAGAAGSAPALAGATAPAAPGSR